MPKKKKKVSGKRKKLSKVDLLREEFRKEDRSLNDSVDYLKKHVDKLWEYSSEAKERLQDLEIQVNLITRLVTTLCLDVLKISPSKLRKMIKKIEDEAIADSQVMHLEQLFRMESTKDDKGESKK